jgi:16S rRNA (cytidine1402-2'-O)-methyltransferase
VVFVLSIKPGTLYVVATPIGNLEDIGQRALQVLRQVHVIAAEDTRHSRKLLQHYGIHTPLLSFHEHNEHARISPVLAYLQSGKSVALVADAGTPLLSDPGFLLLRKLREKGLQAVPIPGPSSLVAALSVAGLPTDRFVFEGFLPAKAGARQHRLEALAQEERTLAFFESSHRIIAALDDMRKILGAERRAVLARELTKLFEEIHGDTLAELGNWIAADENRCKGEFVVLVEGATVLKKESCQVEVKHLLVALLEEMPMKRAVVVAAKITGLRKNILYPLALGLAK